MSEGNPADDGRIHVAIDLRHTSTQLVSVQLEFAARQSTLGLLLPSWTPGSYLIRDYVRHLEDLQVEQSGRPLAVERRAVAAWSVHVEPGAQVRVRYRILATDLSVRTCHLDEDHAFLAMAGVVMLVDGRRWDPWQLTVQRPAGWQVFIPLPEIGSSRWLAPDYDRLVDSPLEAGPHPCHAFSVADVPHRWVGWGGDLPQQDPAWLADVQTLCLTCCRLLGEERPASDDYLFVLHLRLHGFGGLEHDDAAILLYGRRELERPEGRRRLLQLVAHEYLHQWNVRRLRPAELSPIDYSAATIVPTLWFAEGVTSYFDQLLPVAAGLSSEDDVMEDLGADLSRYLLTPGRSLQSLRLSSQEAWVKLYRQDAWSADSQVSYYLKGAVIALILDLHLRRQGSGLAEVLRELWRRFGRYRRGYQESDLLEVLVRHGPDLETLLPGWLEGHDDPDIHSYLQDVGLSLKPQLSARADAGWQLESGPRSELRLRRVSRHGPAAQGGLQVGDELLAIQQQRLWQDQDLQPWLELTETGKPRHQSLDVLYCRDGCIRQTHLRPAPASIERWTLSIDPEAPASARDRRQRWLRLDSEP